MTGETVLITGASAGIGRELAKRFAADGSPLVLVARRKHELDELAAELTGQHGVEARVLPADLADRAAPEAIFEELSSEDVAVDVLVGNAGFGAEGRFGELPLARQMRMLEVNVTALTHLTGLFLPAMLRRGRGGVLNVASTAAFQPGPYMAVYYASKAYVLSLTEALAEEMAATGVTATCLCPGPTRTEFFVRAEMKASPLAKLKTMDARAVAEAGYRGFRAGRSLVVPGVANKIGAASVRLLPRSLVRKAAARLNRSR